MTQKRTLLVVLTKSFNSDSHKLIHCILANNKFMLYALYCDSLSHSSNSAVFCSQSMVTIRTGQVGLHVRPLVVSGSELVTEHVLILCPSSKGNHAKSRAWGYQMKLNIATCDSAEASEILT